MCKFLLASAFCALSMGLYASTVTMISTELRSGETKSFTLNETGQMSFSGRNLLIQQKEDEKVESINLSDIVKLKFTNVDASSLDQSVSIRLNIYPNPVVDELTIETNEPTNVQIIDASGKVVVSTSISQKEVVDMRALSSGTYIVKVGSSTFKIEKL